MKTMRIFAVFAILALSVVATPLMAYVNDTGPPEVATVTNYDINLKDATATELAPIGQIKVLLSAIPVNPTTLRTDNDVGWQIAGTNDSFSANSSDDFICYATGQSAHFDSDLLTGNRIAQETYAELDNIVDTEAGQMAWREQWRNQATPPEDEDARASKVPLTLTLR